jgi:hypothetical protein
MKSLFIIVAMIVNTIIFIPNDVLEDVGVFEFETEIIDYGTITQNSDGNRAFSFKNVGNAPILISEIKTSCGCTIPSKPNKPVMPGETAQIEVKYATSRLGGFSKTLTVMSNANEPKKQLRIKGNVLKDAS